MDSAPHPHCEAWFEQNRPEIQAFVTDVKSEIASGNRHILAKAPVKSGKRELVEYMAVAMPECRVKYITSLNRIDVKNQKEELEKYDIATHLTSGSEAVAAAITDVRVSLSAGRVVVICFDECDYGSGSRQKMARLYSEFINDPRVIKIYFSATAHETEASNLITRADFVVKTYTPPPTYCGAKYFIDAGLVFAPKAFFENDMGTVTVTAHGIKVLQESITSDRHIGVVRTTRSIPTVLFKNRDVRMALELKLRSANPEGKPWQIVPVDQKDSHDWENPVTRRGYVLDPENNYLFVIMQTCTRGTDLKGWHHKLAFWHDERKKEKVNLNTMIQAILRPCHYTTSYGGPQRIRLYVDSHVVEMAHDDDMAKYLAAGGKAPTRTTRGRTPTSGWAIPIRIVLSDDIIGDSRVTTKVSTTGVRDWIHAHVLAHLTPEQRDILTSRTLKNKRTYANDNTLSINKVHTAYTENRPSRPGGGIHSVHRAATENRGSAPGGGMTDEVQAHRDDHYWLDIATSDIPDIPKGTVYITYGLETGDDASSTGSSTPPSPGVRATVSSMFESKRGTTV